MPQLKAAKKSLRQDARKRRFNDRWRRLLHDTIHATQHDSKQESYLKAQSAIDKAVQHNIIHRNKAARLKSKLAKAIK